MPAGRPKLSEDALLVSVTCRLSAQEKALISEAAAESNLTPSRFLRTLIQAQIPIPKSAESD